MEQLSLYSTLCGGDSSALAQPGKASTHYKLQAEKSKRRLEMAVRWVALVSALLYS